MYSFLQGAVCPLRWWEHLTHLRSSLLLLLMGSEKEVGAQKRNDGWARVSLMLYPTTLLPFHITSSVLFLHPFQIQGL